MARALHPSGSEGTPSIHLRLSVQQHCSVGTLLVELGTRSAIEENVSAVFNMIGASLANIVIQHMFGKEIGPRAQSVLEVEPGKNLEHVDRVLHI